MPKLIYLGIGLGLIFLLFFILALLKANKAGNNVKLAQADLVSRQRRIWDRFTFLVALNTPDRLQDAELQTIRKNLYFKPKSANFNSFSQAIDEAKTVAGKSTVSLSLKNELKDSHDDLIKLRQKYDEIVKSWHKAWHNPLTLIFGLLKRKRLIDAAKFQYPEK